jgi:hypothetical protein
MNSLLRLTAAAAAVVISTSALHGQTLTITAPGYSANPLFLTTPGYTLGGLAFDGSANAYYIENDSNLTANAILYRRSTLDGYTIAVPLFDLGAFSYGSFVFVSGGKIYFGDGNGPLRSINPDGTGVNLLGSVANNYDAALLGGNLYVSHAESFSPPKNRVTKFELQADGPGFVLGPADIIVAADNDYSGPLEFDAAGNLYYGASGSSSATGLYRFSAAEVLAAFGPTQLTIDAAHQITSGIGSTALAFAGGDDLWQDRYTGELNLIDADDGSIQPIGSSPNNPGTMDAIGQTLYVGVSTSTRSAVYSVVPEPFCALLALVGLTVLHTRRRRQS